MSHPQTTTPKPFCFVLMPFDSTFDDVYQIGIKEACLAAGAYCERVDEQIFHDRILDRIYNQIAKADLIVADMTGRNANVFYEVGYAHALGKPTVLITQNAGDIPFDLKHFPHIVYGHSVNKLREELARRVQWHVDNPIGRTTEQEIRIELFLNDKALASDNVVHEYPHDEYPNVELTVHNASSSTYKPGIFKIGVITGPSHPYFANPQTVTTRLPNGDYLHMLEDFPTLFPEGFSSFLIRLHPDGAALVEDVEYLPLTVRVYTQQGNRDFGLTLKKGAAPQTNQ